MVKTITIREDVYEKLLEIKGNKGFSEVILELLNKKEIVKKFKGVLRDSKVLREIEK